MVNYPSGVGSDTTNDAYEDPRHYTANRVIQIVRWLEADQLCRDMRDRARRRHELHSMLTVPDLPPHMTRGDSVSVNSPTVMSLLNNILADCRSFPTTTTVIPQGKYNKAQQDKGDEVEKALAIIRARLDDGGRNSHDIRWHQGGTAYGVMILHCGPAGDYFPWTVEIPDPLTCFFPIEGGPVRPSIMGRRYTMLVEEVKAKYGNQKRTEFSDKQLHYDKGEWSWGAKPIGEDQPVEAGDVGDLTTARIGLPGVADNIEMMELYTPQCVYHVALHGTIGADGSRSDNFNGTNGEIVWKANTMTDGIPVVIIPGHVTPLRTPVERFQPVLWAPMQNTLQINMIRAIRMTKAFNWKPDIIVGQDPDMIAALKEAGVLNEPSNVQLEQGGPNLINVAGKPMYWNQPSDQDLDKLEQSLMVERQGYISSMTQQITDEVAKQSTLGGIQLAIGVRKRQLGPMLSNLDWGWAEILKMVVASIKQYKDEFPLFARGGERFAKGELKANDSITIKSDDVDFDFEIVVSTASMTEEERRMLVQDWAYKQTLGISTQAEGIEAAGYFDVADQVEKLALDLAFKHNTSNWAAQIDAVFSDYIRTSGGILIQGGIPPSQPLPPGQGGQGGTPQGGQARPTPSTGTVVGGSTAGPAMIGAGGP